MQATSQANMSFFRTGERDYMMRSEKRPGQRHGTSNGKKKRRRGKKRSNFGYTLLMLLFSVLLWPVGAIMLWRRRLRWFFRTKLLISLVTLVICVGMYAWLLNAPVENPTLARLQENANSALDSAYTAVLGAVDTLADRSDAIGGMPEYMYQSLTVGLANTIETGVEHTADAREAVKSVTDSLRVWFGNLVADISVQNGAEPTPAISATPMPKATATPAPTPTPAPTSTPRPEMPVVEDIPLFTPAPTLAPGASMAPAAPGMAPAPGTVIAATPNNKPQPTGEFSMVPTPTPDASVITPRNTLKPAGKYIVYYNTNGKFYHAGSTCTGMSSASAHSLAAALERNLRRCSVCNPPAPSVTEEYTMWLDGDGMCHVSDDCGRFVGKGSLISREEAMANMVEACTYCHAGEYLVPNSTIYFPDAF